MIRVGTDLTYVPAIAASIARFGDRFLGRIFTEREIATCRASSDPTPRLAARFAAKEAAIKVLRPTDERAYWLLVEVVRTPSGAPELVLHGEARELAARAGLDHLSVSLTHEEAYASAVVVGTQRTVIPARPRRSRRARVSRGIPGSGVPPGLVSPPDAGGVSLRRSMPRGKGAPHTLRSSNDMIEDIRAIVREHGRLTADVSTLAEDADLYQAGLTSHASVNLMLALEDRFEVEFPDRMLRRGVFGSLAAIRAAIEELVGEKA